MDLSRRRYLLAAGSAFGFAGCSSGGTVPADAPTNYTIHPDVPPLEDAVYDLDHTVGKNGVGEYETIADAYRNARAGDVIGLGDGSYSLKPVTTTISDSPIGSFGSLEIPEITVIGRGANQSRVDFGSEHEVLALPSWQLRHLTVTAGDSIVGPRNNTFRTCRITSPIMDPPGYGGKSHQTETDDVLTASGLPRTPSAARTYYGLAFDTVLNAVEDLGFDNTGTEPIDDAFESAYESGTLIEFPPGEYLTEREHEGDNVSRFGIRGLGTSRRDVQIKPVEGARLKWLNATDSGPHLVENLSLHERSDDTSQLSLRLTTSGGSVLKNVEWLGRTPNDSDVGYSLAAEVTDQDGVFVIDGIYAGLDEPAMEVSYPNGVAFLRSGPLHKGEVVLRDPVIHERNSAATRSTAPTGVLTIEGGEFVNNQNANIRFGAGDHPSKVSSATGCYVRVDGSRNSTDAVRVEGERYTGAVFRDIEIEWTKRAARGVITFPDYATHGSAEFYDCVVRNDGEETLTVNAAFSPDSNDDVVFDNCSFTGSGRGFYADNRDGSVIRDSCIDLPNGSIRGFETVNADRSDCRRPQAPDAVTPTITANKSGETTVDFSAADSTYLDGAATSYTWELDDTTETGETISRTFPEAGTYSVALAVENESGETNSTTTELIVNYPRLV
ncbi:PKD domain-containing protein [Halapricum hydrolyticum]|uniref:PKD domain-containing protein n=1 Tax=Halapricum hydrolyticum TaxID=2979991 RepID=A0AAE3IF13_9EURY|nr:PKD domain-containing protein [Halapricum hydrolyticum]MCU4719596.1 PKD domain-containing protein [Halapricum hydrolyticum]MCU4728108.1 PKD domain-containing protein [Halapricum hydrolyticum]